MFGLFAKVKSESINSVDELIGTINLIDVREVQEVRMGTIRTAKNIPMGNLLSTPEKYLDKNQTYYLMCQSGGRSGRCAKALAGKGYDVVNLTGGYGSYTGSKRKK